MTNPLLHHIVLVTGPSGAGRSTATDALEDAGFEVIDNLPLRLILPLLEQSGTNGPLALGLDARNRDFSAHAVLDLLDTLEARSDIQVQLLYLDCAPEEIQRRYSGTRRRHPVRGENTLADAIAREIELLQPVRARADTLIDTTDLNPHELRADIVGGFAPQARRELLVQVQSFSYKRGLPRGADLVFDCRFLRNPHWEDALRPLDGRDDRVRAFVRGDARFDAFFAMTRDLSLFMLPAARDEGKSYITFAFGCTGGRHRSVTLVEMLAQTLAEQGWGVSIRHRELERQGKRA